MEGYDTMTMQYLGNPMQLGSIQQQPLEYLNSLPGMDMGDQHSNFDTDTFLRYVSGGCRAEDESETDSRQR